MFDRYICNEKKVIGFADNFYANGADIKFVSYLLNKTSECKRNITQWAYAGWNTNGNTLGTVISNSILVSFFEKNTQSY